MILIYINVQYKTVEFHPLKRSEVLAGVPMAEPHRGRWAPQTRIQAQNNREVFLLRSWFAFVASKCFQKWLNDWGSVKAKNPTAQDLFAISGDGDGCDWNASVEILRVEVRSCLSFWMFALISKRLRESTRCTCSLWASVPYRPCKVRLALCLSWDFRFQAFWAFGT